MDEVIAAFGLVGVVPVQLPGGQGTTWRAGQVILKPADSLLAGRWFADVYDGLNGPGFRVPPPGTRGDLRCRAAAERPKTVGAPQPSWRQPGPCATDRVPVRSVAPQPSW